MFLFAGDGYNISQMGSSISYPNSPTSEYYSNEAGVVESELQPEGQSQLPHSHSHHHHFTRPATLGRNSARFGTGKSPFRVVVPSNPSATPPVCSTPQNSLPILESLEARERVIPEFSTFGNSANGFLPKQRIEPAEPSGHLV